MDATTRRGSSGCPQTGGRRWGGRALQRSAAPRSVGVTMAMAARWQRLVVKRHNDGGGAVPHRCGWGQPAGDPPPAGSGLRREGNDRGAAGATPAVTPPSRAPHYDTPFPRGPAPTSQDRPHAVAWGGQEGGGGVGPLCCWRACPRALLLLPLSHCLSPLFFFFSPPPPPDHPRPTRPFQYESCVAAAAGAGAPGPTAAGCARGRRAGVGVDGMCASTLVFCTEPTVSSSSLFGQPMG